MGARLAFPGSPKGESILTAGHLFPMQMPACRWSFRDLWSASSVRLPLVDVQPLPVNPLADVAIGVPGTVLQVSSPLPNFFHQGGKWSGELSVDIREPEERKTLISTISGEHITSVGQAVYDGAPYEILDYASMLGESGTVLWDEHDLRTVYVLKGDGESTGAYLRSKGLTRSGKATLALRLSMR